MTSDDVTRLRLESLESAVENIGDAMEIFTEFMLAARIWAKVAVVVMVALFGIVQPVVVALIVKALS